MRRRKGRALRSKTSPGPDPVLFVGDLYPSRIYKVSLQGEVLGVYERYASASSNSTSSRLHARSACASW
jgi:hypothetical protein